MTRTTGNITALTLAMLVAVLAVAAPLCLAPKCTAMTSGPRSPMVAMGVCPPAAGHTLSAACAGMRPGSSVPAATVAKASLQPDVAAVTVAGIVLPDPGIAAADASAPGDHPPRPALETIPLLL